MVAFYVEGFSMHLFILFFVLLIFPVSGAWAQEGQCTFRDAQYVPQGQTIADSYDPAVNLVNKTLSFVMRIDMPDTDCHAPERCRFIYIDAYDKAGQKVSTMRLGNNWSLGVSREYFSNYYGQFGDADEEWSEKMVHFSFNPISLNRNLRPAAIMSVPDLIILSNTFQELKGAIQDTENWDRYIEFYTQDRTYPDFRGYDFWERKACDVVGKTPSDESAVIQKTTLRCGGISSQIVSVCENNRAPLCQSQNWAVADKQINLKADFPDDFRVSDWACVDVGGKDYIIMQSHNGGNCDGCERHMIWTADGDYVAGWRDFGRVFREKNFPDYRSAISSKMQRVLSGSRGGEQ